MTHDPFPPFVLDSRDVHPGCTFVAIRGEKSDGHNFLRQAKERGAVAALVEQEYAGGSFGLTLFRVPSPVKALQQFAKEKIQNSPHLKIVGVTGSVGKTSTKEYLATLLEPDFRIVKTPGNWNTKITLPLIILNHNLKECDLLILEMGMSEPGDLKLLVDIAPPQIALLTAVANVHRENFSSEEEIAFNKAHIFSHPETKVGFLPEEWYELLREEGICAKKSFSFFAEETALPDHHRGNIAAALAAARELGVSEETLMKRLPLLKLPPKRMERVEKEGVIWINDSYNAGPLSMRGALSALAKEQGRRVALLGDMRELGEISAKEHRAMGEYALGKADLLIGYGEEAKLICEAWESRGLGTFHTSDRAQLKEYLAAHVRKGDAVLVKGSNSLKMWEFV